MPTTHPRHAVTETPEVARALDLAAARWPDVPRSRLPTLVLADWADGPGSQAARDAALAQTEGALPGIGGLYDRGEDWPA
ncbi:hypothetical protein [Iamia sp.]|uniref:hypothetical protein n=1 Tax=Iamia sp. TaxID=2722710 RepID=UPI002C6CEEE4|nr:hypothetical protein [Iamia sp.]HXH58358.1 hypothetical protein [Iamia sp.]